MKTLIAHRKNITLLLSLFSVVIATSALVSYWASTARALTVPKTNPLFYSGLLADTAGKPLAAATATVGLALYPAQSGGSAVCSMAPAATPLTQGRFRIALSAACVTALQENPDLWIEVTVGTSPMARTKIGAVPYVLAPDMLKVDGDASLTIHSNTDTPTSGSNMLVLKTGSTVPVKLFGVSNTGSVSAKKLYASELVSTDSLLLPDGSCFLGVEKKTNGNLRIHCTPGIKFSTWLSGVTLYPMVIKRTGEVGIGTTTPDYLLHLKKSGTTSSELLKLENADASSTGASAWTLQHSDDGTFGIDRNGIIDDFIITASGNVGLGTATPKSKLAVKGLPTSPPDTSGTAGLVCVTKDGNMWLDTTPSTPCQ